MGSQASVVWQAEVATYRHIPSFCAVLWLRLQLCKVGEWEKRAPGICMLRSVTERCEGLACEDACSALQKQ